MAATLALLRNQPNSASAVALQAHSAALAAATGIGSSLALVDMPVAGLQQNEGCAVGLKREREGEQDLESAEQVGGEAAGAQAIEKRADGGRDEAEPGAAMDDREARRMRRKKMRKLQKQLAVELDMLLPRLGANNKSYKWAGRRSVGRTGRSLVEILVDAAKNVRSILEAKGISGSGGDAAGRSAMGGGDVGGSKALCLPLASGYTSFYKQGLLASQSLGVVELSLPDLSLLECSAAFRTYARVAPAGSAHSQKLDELLPRCDVLAVHALINKVRPLAPAPVGHVVLVR